MPDPRFGQLGVRTKDLEVDTYANTLVFPNGSLMLTGNDEVEFKPNLDIDTISVAGTGAISPTANDLDHAVIKLTGVLTGTRILNWPSTGNRQQVTFWNATSGAFNLFVKTPTEATGVRVSAGQQAILINDGTNVIDITAAVSSVPFYVLEYDGSPQTVDCGNFWDSDSVDLGSFFWESWAKIGAGGGSGHYLISEGYGGNHAILFSGSDGNVYDGAAITSFGADDGPYIDQWAHQAVGWSDGKIVVYYDGVPVGATAFAGPRRASTSGGSNLFIGGSDHSNFIGRIATVRGFEGDNPQKQSVGNSRHLAAFVPQTVFGTQFGAGPSFPQASFLCEFYRPEQIITDKSKGYPEGNTHSARIRGTGHGFGSNYTADRSNYPSPQYVTDPGSPQALTLTAPIQPAGKIYSPIAPPSGALIFDSFQRKNSTFAWEGVGGLGSTESGSLGTKVWTSDEVHAGVKAFGILNEKVVMLGNGNLQAHVDPAQANLDIKVNRVSPRTWGMGRTTSIVFRYVDNLNYWCAMVMEKTATIEDVWICKKVAGVETLVTQIDMTASWVTLRVVTKSDGTLQVYSDATQLYNTPQADLQTATKTGIGTWGPYFGHGLSKRWLNFTILAAA